MNLLSSLLKFTADKLGALISSTTSLGNRLTTAEGDIDSLEAQFTTVVSAVTTDTEVTNIRVGDDDVTYDTAGIAVRTQFSNVKSAINDLDNVIYPDGKYTPATISASKDLTAANNYVDLGMVLAVGVKYDFTLAFSATPTNLTNVYMNTGQSGSGSVSTVTSDLVGDQTKTFSYTPTVSGIKYIRIQFSSSYSGNLSVTVSGAYNLIRGTVIQEIDGKFSEVAVDIDRPYNLIPTDCVITSGKAIRYSDGEVINDSTRCVTDYIPIDASQGYICNCAKVVSREWNPTTQTHDSLGVNPLVLRYMAFYDEMKRFVATTSANDAISKVIPTNAKYIRVTIASDDLVDSAMLIYGNYNSIPGTRYVAHRRTPTDVDVRTNTGFENFTMVMFGDSITHGDQYIDHNGISYVDYANDNLHSNIINVGFGGSRMSHYGASGGTAYFSFDRLADAIVSNDWTDQDAAVVTETTYDLHLATLKAVDWDEVEAIGILYGANDWHSDTPISASYEINSATFNGACAYGLDKLLTAYPHLQVIIFTPMFRETTLGDASTSSDVANGAGLTMADYGDSLKIVQDVFHCALVDSGRNFGINKYNVHLYTMDGTHPRTNLAQRRLGYLFAESIRKWISPYGKQMVV